MFPSPSNCSLSLLVPKSLPFPFVLLSSPSTRTSSSSSLSAATLLLFVFLLLFVLDANLEAHCLTILGTVIALHNFRVHRCSRLRRAQRLVIRLHSRQTSPSSIQTIFHDARNGVETANRKPLDSEEEGWRWRRVFFSISFDRKLSIRGEKELMRSSVARKGTDGD